MPHDENTVRSAHNALGPGVGLMMGVALGISIGLLFAPTPGAAFRKKVSELVAQLQAAARQGRRKARRHLVVLREPSRTGLIGVDGLAESF